MAGCGAKRAGVGSPIVLCCRISFFWGKTSHWNVHTWNLEPAMEAAMQRAPPLPPPAALHLGGGVSSLHIILLLLVLSVHSKMAYQGRILTSKWPLAV